MEGNMFKKALAVGIILLFIIICFNSVISKSIEEKKDDKTTLSDTIKIKPSNITSFGVYYNCEIFADSSRGYALFTSFKYNKKNAFGIMKALPDTDIHSHTIKINGQKIKDWQTGIVIFFTGNVINLVDPWFRLHFSINGTARVLYIF